MRILFVHRNFPGQFRHLAPALQKRGHEVLALADNTSPVTLKGVKLARYRLEDRRFDLPTFRLAKTFAEASHRGEAVALAAREINDRIGFKPDIVFGCINWGETMFLREVWPDARHLAYAEFLYRALGLDTGFDKEFSNVDFAQQLWISSRRAHILAGALEADRILIPTRWQASTFPAVLKDRISVIHDGIDTRRLSPADDVSVEIPEASVRFRKGDEVLTFINRNLEPYRGYHIFMRALPAVLAARKNAHVVIVGGLTHSYSPPAPGGQSWKKVFLDEVKDKIDLSRVHFAGTIAYPAFVDLMRVTRVHAYLTVPFVLSWSMLEAMAAGALVVGSKTPPVEEIIKDGVNGRLVDFFDIDGWSKVLIDALAHPERYEAMRREARRTIVENYDLETKCLPRLIDFVEKA